MSRKVIITLAAAATIAAAGLASTSTYARGFGGGDHMFARGGGAGASGHGGLRMARNPGHPILSVRSVRPIRPGHPIVVGRLHRHHHWHWAFRDGRWIEVDDVAVETPVELPPAVTPAPCTCLTKTYTPTGLVVFADVCTKESASAPATSDAADASKAPTTAAPANTTPITQVPTTPNYAGRTYDDYLAANPQAAPEASSQPSQQSPSTPRQN